MVGHLPSQHTSDWTSFCACLFCKKNGGLRIQNAIDRTETMYRHTILFERMQKTGLEIRTKILSFLTECKRRHWKYVIKHYPFWRNAKDGTGNMYQNTILFDGMQKTGLEIRTKILSFLTECKIRHWKYVIKYDPFRRNAKDGTGNHIIRLERRD